MRRFFHRKGQPTRDRPTGSHSANGAPLGVPPRLRGLATGSPNHAATTSGIGRVRAPALRSRSMSVLCGPEADATNAASATSGRSKRFTVSRSLSFSDDHHPVINSPPRKLLTQSEEDEVFNMYTQRLYFMFAVLAAAVMGFVIYAFVYNMGKSQVK